jgi:hypothetical protein
MRIPFTSNSALAAADLFLFLAKATGATRYLPHSPSAIHSPYILSRNDSVGCPGQSSLNITLQNNHGKPLFFYVTGKNPEARDSFVILGKQGDCYAWTNKPTHPDLFPTVPYYFVDTTEEGGSFHSEIQVDNSVSFVLPSYVNSARLYVAEERLRFGTTGGGPGEGLVEPSPTNNGLPEYNIIWQFIEFTYGQDNFILNPSYVDFAAMSLDITLESRSGQNMRAPGLEANGLDNICEKLEEQSKRDNQSWEDFCLKDNNGNNVRAISPNLYLALHPDDKMAKYYEQYVDSVWSKFSAANLTINTQDDGRGNKVDQGRKFICSVKPDDNMLWCEDEDGQLCDKCDFRKPNTAEIMGCVQTTDGPFRVDGESRSLIVPRLCAAFTRSTLLLPGGELQPNSNITADLYYKAVTTNHYSRIIHEGLLNHTGYAFAYDDANPATDEDKTSNAAGVIRDSDPRVLTITVR